MFKTALNLFHVIATVTNLDKVLDYYLKVLDFRLVMDARNLEAIAGSGRRINVAVVERADDVLAMMEFTEFIGVKFERPSEPPPYGLWAVTWEVKDLDKIYNEWVKRGVEFTQKPNVINIPGAGKFYSAFMKDINGHRIELAQYLK